jgi:hypothetical protein
MTPRRNSVEGLIEALQSDLPTGADEARVRAKLVGAGVLASGVLTGASAGAATVGTAPVGTASLGTASLGTASLGTASLGTASLGTAASGGTSAGTAASVAGQVGLWSQVAALPVIAKLGAATTLLAVAASVGVSYTSVSPTSQSSAGRTTASQGGAKPAHEVAAELPESAPALAPLPKASPEAAQLPLAEVPRKEISSEATTAVAEREVTPASPPVVNAKSALRATTLAQETPLIERAMLAIQAGDSARARYWLAEHARLFPQGLLARERSLAAARIAAEQP